MPISLSPITRAHKCWQTQLSFAHRRQQANLARLDSFYYATWQQGLGKRFYADIAQTRCAAQNNRVCRGLDAAFERLQLPHQPLAAPTPWRDAAAMVGCFFGAVARQILDVGACLVGVLVGGWRSLKAYAPITVQAPERLAPALQQTLGQHAPQDPLNIPYSGAAGETLNICQQFHTDAHRVDISIEHTAYPDDTPMATYSQVLTQLCDGDALWARHVSRMLTQEVGNSLLQTLLEGGMLTTNGATLLLVDGDANRPTRPRFVATRATADSVTVQFSLTKSVRRLVVADAEVYCKGSLATSVTLQVPRPERPHAPAAPRVERVAIQADIPAFSHTDLGD